MGLGERLVKIDCERFVGSGFDMMMGVDCRADNRGVSCSDKSWFMVCRFIIKSCEGWFGRGVVKIVYILKHREFWEQLVDWGGG